MHKRIPHTKYEMLYRNIRSRW